MSSTRGVNSPIRHVQDLYQTQPWVCDAWAKRAALAAGQHHAIVDLGCGDGRIGMTVAEATRTFGPVVMIDSDPSVLKSNALVIIYGVPPVPVDYMDPSVDPANLAPSVVPANLAPPGRPVLFVSNPPFSLATEFVVKTVEALPRCPEGSMAVFLLRLNWYGSLKRVEWINKHPQDALTGLRASTQFHGRGIRFVRVRVVLVVP